MWLRFPYGLYTQTFATNFMSDTAKHITIRITKSEFDLINEIIDYDSDLFIPKQINDSEYILNFEHMDTILQLDELIKDKLIYQVFDKDYITNRFGQICENFIDKFYEIIK